jgi:hypothetical protein
MLQWLYTHVASVYFMFQAYVSSVSCVSDVCFKCFILMMQKYIWMLYNMHVASICFKCLRCFIRMLQVFHLDVAKVNLNIACVCNGFKCFQMFFASISDVYCKCFIHMLQGFYLDVAKVNLMLHMLQ